jgi:small glutamine-rich tetratricopeptide repeat-containing protein alpha
MSGKSNPTTRRLAASIVKFLQDAQKNGTLDSEDAESMEVAVTIISESFGLDTTPADAANLLQVFDLYEKTREKMVRAPNNPGSCAAVLTWGEGRGGVRTVE